MATRTPRTRSWFSVIFPIACLFVFAYPIQRLGQWFSGGDLDWLVYALVVWGLSIAVMRHSFSGPNMKIRYVVVHWMGISFVLASVTLAVEIIRIVVSTPDAMLARLAILSTAACIVIAVLLSHVIAIKKFEIRTTKVKNHYRIAQISDIHIGSRQGGYMTRIVDKLNQLSPDFVVVTGDLIDSSAVGYDALESLGRLDAKTLFVIGNHERYADLPKILDIARRLGMQTLRQQTSTNAELNFIGIDDADDKNQVSRELPKIKLDLEKFNVLLYHRPMGWESAMEHGIELMLSGHTHNGQIFPFNLLVKQQFSRISGMYHQGDSRLYVSSGTGTWGPLMRLGSLNEISVFDIQPLNIN